MGRAGFYCSDADIDDVEELSVNPVKTVRLLQALLTGPATRIELAQQSDINPKYVGEVLRELKKRDMAYVIDYTNNTDGRNRVKIWSLGEGEDAKPKRPQPQHVRSRKSYLKKVEAQRAVKIKTTFVGGSLWQ